MSSDQTTWIDDRYISLSYVSASDRPISLIRDDDDTDDDTSRNQPHQFLLEAEDERVEEEKEKEEEASHLLLHLFLIFVRRTDSFVACQKVD
uniref:Uncharacterized protein n=1 Tax=Caenorhabditis japonica TaxID=281687 RepID=A0A8R1II37_CAEJA